jgi:hypothetical protein
MITLTKIRDLDIASSPGARTYLSAASGLVRAGMFLYVIADDELHLAVFGTTGNGPGELVCLFDGELPASPHERKKLKPDLEALTLLPPSLEFPNGTILALGSGSKRNRRGSAVLGLDAHGAVRGLPEIVDLSPIFDPLDDLFPKLNIEGVVVSGDEMRLFQRGNKRSSDNAVIRFSLPAFLAALSGEAEGAIAPLAIHGVDLGEIDGIPFCFTDAAALPNGDMVFTAVAEDTEDTYTDGPCAGVAIGIVENNGHLRHMVRLDPLHKIEGVDAHVEADVLRLLLVTDADDPAIPASLFSATMEA